MCHQPEIASVLKDFVYAFLRDKKKGPVKAEFFPIPADGSTRAFFRIRLPKSETSYVAMANPPTTRYAQKENTAYLHIGRHLKKKGLPVPNIHACDLARGLFILEDFGDLCLQEAIKAVDDPYELYQEVIQLLLEMQTKGREGFDINWTCQTTHYDKEVMLKLESDYFVKAFLEDYLGLPVPKRELDKSFSFIAQMASAAAPGFLMHRDFQSRNIMVRDTGLGILDWQGARLGPLGYDLASLLIDPYVALQDSLKARLFETYVSELRCLDRRVAEELLRTYPYLAIQRNLQILGAFSYLTKTKHKPHFQPYIPLALHNLRALLEQVEHDTLDPLRTLIGQITLDIAPSHV